MVSSGEEESASQPSTPTTPIDPSTEPSTMPATDSELREDLEAPGATTSSSVSPPPPLPLPPLKRTVKLVPEARRASHKPSSTETTPEAKGKVVPLRSILKKEDEDPSAGSSQDDKGKRKKRTVKFRPSKELVEVREFAWDPEERRLNRFPERPGGRMSDADESMDTPILSPHDMEIGEAKAAFAPWECSDGGPLGPLLPWVKPTGKCPFFSSFSSHHLPLPLVYPLTVMLFILLYWLVP